MGLLRKLISNAYEKREVRVLYNPPLAKIVERIVRGGHIPRDSVGSKSEGTSSRI
jgi:hypothetical protein